MHLHPEDLTAIRGLLREELGLIQRGLPEVPMPPALAEVPADRFCADLPALAAATGLTRDLLRAVKKAGIRQQDSPFRGHGAFPADVRRWLDARPGFKAPTRLNGVYYRAQRAL